MPQILLPPLDIDHMRNQVQRKRDETHNSVRHPQTCVARTAMSLQGQAMTDV